MERYGNLNRSIKVEGHAAWSERAEEKLLTWPLGLSWRAAAGRGESWLKLVLSCFSCDLWRRCLPACLFRLLICVDRSCCWTQVSLIDWVGGTLMTSSRLTAGKGKPAKSPRGLGGWLVRW